MYWVPQISNIFFIIFYFFLIFGTAILKNVLGAPNFKYFFYFFLFIIMFFNFWYCNSKKCIGGPQFPIFFLMFFYFLLFSFTCFHVFSFFCIFSYFWWGCHPLWMGYLWMGSIPLQMSSGNTSWHILTAEPCFHPIPKFVVSDVGIR